jgi:hypothetical protein
MRKVQAPPEICQLEDYDFPMPDDMDEFRRGLARKFLTFLKEWKTCPRRDCRRARQCIALQCLRTHPKTTEDETTQAIHAMRAALTKSLAAKGYVRQV